MGPIITDGDIKMLNSFRNQQNMPIRDPIKWFEEVRQSWLMTSLEVYQSSIHSAIAENDVEIRQLHPGHYVDTTEDYERAQSFGEEHVFYEDIAKNPEPPLVSYRKLLALYLGAVIRLSSVSELRTLHATPMRELY